MLNRTQVQQALDAGGGLLRLEPSWVPRSFMVPGRRLKLHPDDVYALGGHRGGINERWFSSTTNADNGPGTPQDEGLSYVRLGDGTRFLLKDAVDQAGDLLLGKDVMEREKGWNLLCKFFDNLGADPAPHAPERRAGQAARPQGQARGLLLPAAIQRDVQQLPVHLHGPRAGDDEGGRAPLPRELEPRRQRHHLPVARLPPRARHRLADRPGILHAPGSLVTYEPQVNSDVFAMYESEVDGRIVPWDLLVKDVLPEHHKDLDYIVDMLDWDANTNPNFGADNKRFPKPVASGSPKDAGCQELWVCYGTDWYSAKELTVQPKRTVTIKDSAAYGIIVTQGYGRFGKLPVSTPSMIRFGQMTEDELFVSAAAAAEGRDDREPQRIGSAGRSQALRPGKPGCEGVGYEEEVANSGAKGCVCII